MIETMERTLRAAGSAVQRTLTELNTLRKNILLGSRWQSPDDGTPSTLGKLSGIFKCIQQINRRTSIQSQSGEATYYLILNIIPFLVLLINLLFIIVAPYSDLIKEAVQALPILGLEAVSGKYPSEVELMRDFLQVLPFDAAALINDKIDVIIASRLKEFNLVSIITLCFIVWTSAQGVAVLVQAIDPYVYNPEGFIEWLVAWLIVRIKSLFFAVLLVGLIVFTLMSTIFGNMLLYDFQYLAADFPILPQISASTLELWDQIIYKVPFLWLVGTLTFFYHYAPSREHRNPWKTSLVAAALVSIVWAVITFAYSAYIMNWSSLGPIYGSLLGIILLFVWLRMMCTLIILGGYILLGHKMYQKAQQLPSVANTNGS